MATRIMDEKGYAKHQAKFGKKLDVQAEINATIKRRSKYGNVKTVVDGVKMDSKREAKRYRELGLLLKAGEIDFLARQVRFRLPGGVEYVADFVYGDSFPVSFDTVVLDNIVVEDAKGVRTRDFINKKKQMLSEHGINVVEV